MENIQIATSMKYAKTEYKNLKVGKPYSALFQGTAVLFIYLGRAKKKIVIRILKNGQIELPQVIMYSELTMYQLTGYEELKLNTVYSMIHKQKTMQCMYLGLVKNDCIVLRILDGKKLRPPITCSYSAITILDRLPLSKEMLIEFSRSS